MGSCFPREMSLLLLGNNEQALLLGIWYHCRNSPSSILFFFQLFQDLHCSKLLSCRMFTCTIAHDLNYYNNQNILKQGFHQLLKLIWRIHIKPAIRAYLELFWRAELNCVLICCRIWTQNVHDTEH